MNREKLANILKDNGPDAAIVAATAIIDNGNAPEWVYIVRSEAFWASGAMGKALSDLHKAMEISPSDEIAQRIRIAERIIAFHNTDILNP